jgi:hypothetical protein
MESTGTNKQLAGQSGKLENNGYILEFIPRAEKTI